MKFKIISDGSCDLPKAFAIQNGVDVVPFYVSFDGFHYKKEGIDIDIRDFYQQMIDSPKIYPKSSLPSVDDYLQSFLPYIKQNIPIICICITTKFSGSYNSASTAKDIILDDFPDAKIAVIDSMVNTVLQGNFVREAVRMQQAGLSFEDTLTILEDLRPSGRILFTIGSVEYLRAGGRIGKMKGFAADTLGLKPLIVLKDGEIHQNGITRNRKKGRLKLVAQFMEYMKQTGDNPENYSLCIGYGYDEQEGADFRTELLEALKGYAIYEKDIPLFQIGATIGVHTGPLPIGIGLVRKYDAPPLAAVSEADGLLYRAYSLLTQAKVQVANTTGQVVYATEATSQKAKTHVVQAKEQLKEQIAQAASNVLPASAGSQSR